MLGITSILYAGLLLVNAVAVLSEDRFLARSMSYALTRLRIISLIAPSSWLGIYPSAGSTSRIRTIIRAAV